MRQTMGVLLLAALALASQWEMALAAPAAPPPIHYAAKRTFSQWVDDLPEDPTLLIGFIISLLSGVGFLFVIYAVVYELIMGIPMKRQSILTGPNRGYPAQGSEKLAS